MLIHKPNHPTTRWVAEARRGRALALCSHHILKSSSITENCHLNQLRLHDLTAHAEWDEKHPRSPSAMCGIFASASKTGPQIPSAELKSLLCNRGPDHAGEESLKTTAKDGSEVSLTFFSTVLALRGGHVTKQPLKAASRSILCWNGEAWKIGQDVVEGNDGERILNLLMTDSPNTSKDDAIHHVLNVLRSISGPYAFVYFDRLRNFLYFGRDCLGRRSLLINDEGDELVQFSSVADSTNSTWREVEADGIYMMDISETSVDPCINGLPSEASIFPLVRFKWSVASEKEFSLGELNRIVPELEVKSLTAQSKSVKQLEVQLHNALKLRVLNIPSPSEHSRLQDSRLAILFSGGLDCTVLARMAHDLLPAEQSIDLLNVGFENPRVVQAAKKSQLSDVTYPTMYELCPDRITGRNAVRELREVCPGRNWRFVEVNVPYADTMAHKAKVISLIYPHNTEMDLSIAYALYFASRGEGTASINDKDVPIQYKSPARVLLSGLGADELFGGYIRHATAFSRQSFTGLLDELELDVNRLGKRNLGRDDRVISNWEREVRFPYLDESLVKWALDLPVWEKCDFGSQPGGDKEEEIEPGKKVLRLLAWKLGMCSVSREKKRAIQFGARTAKMETGRTKGTTLIS